MDGSAGRKVWFQYWESQITFQRSYFSRLRYVHEDAVHHGLVRGGGKLRMLFGPGWFERTASAAFRKTILTFAYGRLSIPDDFATNETRFDAG
jgi:putative transposase